ncbi:hypothetical protein KAR91_34525 [Candidatus Pacearchaeota archaeon]|nr:hypothetical protein [Candidatus Pacearchaeota archaeon]
MTDSGVAVSIIGGLLAVMFSIIHGLQNRRLNKVEDDKVNKETCDVGHKALGREMKEMKDMVRYLYDDRRTWKRSNGHEV